MKNCYYSYYDSTTLDTKTITSLKNGTWRKDLKDLTLNKKISDYYIRLSEVDNTNYVKTYQDLENFINNIFSEIPDVNENSNYFTLSSRYSGRSYDFYLSIDFVNYNVLKLVHDITYLDYMLWDDGLKAIIISFTFFQPQSRFYYYVTITYEFLPEGGFSQCKIDLGFFKTGIYDGDSGNIIKSFDFLRVCFSFILLVFSIYDIISMRINLIKKNRYKNIFAILFSVRIITEILIISLYVASYIIKLYYLNDNNMSLLINKNSGYLSRTKPLYDFYWIYLFYRIDNIIEGIILIFNLIRIFLHFFSLKRINSFSFFLVHTLTNITGFLFIILNLLFAFCVLANNLFGDTIEAFRDFESSFLSMMMASVGHIGKYNFRRNIENKFWSILILFFFFLFLVYFLVYTFIGVYIESFRIVSLRKGHSFDRKNKDSDMFVKIISKKRKNDNNKTKDVKLQDTLNKNVDN